LVEGACVGAAARQIACRIHRVHGTPFPKDALESIRQNRVALVSPVLPWLVRSRI